MPRSTRSNHIVLHDVDENLKTGLMPLVGEDGKMMYEWVLAPALAPDVSEEDVSYGQFRPEQEMTWNMNDWSGGANKFYYNRQSPNRYAIADKVWALTPNEVSLGPHPVPITFAIRNGAAQLGNTNGWAASGITITAVTTAPHTGTYHFQGTSWSTNDYAQATVQQSEQPVGRWVGQAVTAVAMVRGDESGGTMRMQIVESGGSSTPTTSGSTVAISTSYQQISATVTLQADSTGIVLRIQMSADGGSNRTIYFDSCQILPGSAIPNASNCQMKYMNGDLYAVTDRAVWKMDETNDYWSLQKVHGAAITGFEVYDDRLYIGQGESTAYQYSDAQDATTWTAAGGSGDLGKANRFAKSLNVNGNWALAKSLNDDEIYLATDPTGSAVWGTAIEVGKDDHDILQLYQLAGTLGVGKEDGFYQYLTLVGNRFINIYPDAEAMVDSDNFSRGIFYQGMFYTSLGEIGLVRFNGSGWQDISYLLQSPGFSDFGNRARAFGTDGSWLYVLVEDLNADSISKQSWLYALKEFSDGSWATHQVTSLVLSDALDMTMFKSSGGTNRHLYINGDINDVAAAHRIPLPNRTDTPRHATNASMALQGTLITPFWDGNRPQVQKSFDKLTVLSENLTSNRTITASYMLDNETSFTNINSASSEYNSNPSNTVGFNDGVTGRRIRLKFTFATNDATDSPVMKGFGLHFAWRPERLRRWTIVAAVEDNIRQLQGVPHALPAKTQLQQLKVLQESTSPIVLQDIDGTKFRTHIIEMSETQVQARVTAGAGVHLSRAVSIALIEVVRGGWGFGRWNYFNWG